MEPNYPFIWKKTTVYGVLAFCVQIIFSSLRTSICRAEISTEEALVNWTILFYYGLYVVLDVMQGFGYYTIETLRIKQCCISIATVLRLGYIRRRSPANTLKCSLLTLFSNVIMGIIVYQLSVLVDNDGNMQSDYNHFHGSNDDYSESESGSSNEYTSEFDNQKYEYESESTEESENDSNNSDHTTEEENESKDSDNINGFTIKEAVIDAFKQVWSFIRNTYRKYTKWVVSQENKYEIKNEDETENKYEIEDEAEDEIEDEDEIENEDETVNEDETENEVENEGETENEGEIEIENEDEIENEGETDNEDETENEDVIENEDEIENESNKSECESSKISEEDNVTTNSEEDGKITFSKESVFQGLSYTEKSDPTKTRTRFLRREEEDQTETEIDSRDKGGYESCSDYTSSYENSENALAFYVIDNTQDDGKKITFADFEPGALEGYDSDNPYAIDEISVDGDQIFMETVPVRNLFAEVTPASYYKSIRKVVEWIQLNQYNLEQDDEEDAHQELNVVEADSNIKESETVKEIEHDDTDNVDTHKECSTGSS